MLDASAPGRRLVRPWWTLVAFACLAPLLPASGRSTAAWNPADNVIIITLDTTRADRLPAYGYQQVETPALDRLAREAVVFEQATSSVPLTLPAHCTIFTRAFFPFTTASTTTSIARLATPRSRSRRSCAPVGCGRPRSWDRWWSARSAGWPKDSSVIPRHRAPSRASVTSVRRRGRRRSRPVDRTAG